MSPLKGLRTEPKFSTINISSPQDCDRYGHRAPSHKRNGSRGTRSGDERVLRISAWFATSAKAGCRPSERRLVSDRRRAVASVGRGGSWRLAEFAPPLVQGW